MSQHLNALQMANVSRLRVAQIKRSVSELLSPEGERRAAEILRFETDTAAVRIDELLLAIRGFGSRRVGRLLALAGLPLAAHAKRVSGLTDRQRDVIAGLLDQAADEVAARRTA